MYQILPALFDTLCDQDERQTASIIVVVIPLVSIIVQWNFRITDTMGPTNLSLVQRFP